MSREEQIKNMARAIHLNCHKGLTSTEAEMIAKWCYQEIDKKASEVAREIFAEIERALNLSKFYGDSGIYFEKDIETDIAELKKKYMEEK